MAGEWNAAQLCTIEDVTNEIGSLSLVLGVREEDTEFAFVRAATAAKLEIGRHCKTHLPDVYARNPFYSYPYNNWLQFIGYNYQQTDNILDLIKPLEELNSSAVAYTIIKAYTIQITQLQASRTSVSPVLHVERERWDVIAKQRIRDDLKRIYIDFAGLGQPLDIERRRIRTGFPIG